MKGLGQIEIRCRDHEMHDSKCAICRFLRSCENDFASLKIRRARLFLHLKERLASRELIIIDLR